jgi:GTP cyclohydrolase I
VFEHTDLYNQDVHQVARLATQYYLTLTFKAMKVDLTDPNTTEIREEGNIGTPGRLAKLFLGSDLSDSTELLSGRWTKPPRMASFPNNHEQRLPITKRVDLVSCCSHHIAPFSTFFREDAYAIVSYIPDKKVLGISKLQRVVDWIARRGWLQESLTKEIYNEISKVAETESVYVRLVNVSHTCESLRGSKTQDGAFTTEYYGGEFNNNEIRKEVRG